MTLKKHLKAGSKASLKPVIALGHKAAAIRLDTLDMVRIHERALSHIPTATLPPQHIKQSEEFFTEAISPIEQTHPAARTTQDKVRRAATALDQRTKKLAVSKLSFKKGMIHQKLIRAKLKKDQAHQARMLKESIHLQKNLRQLTHELIRIKESKSKEMGLRLHNEITQTLIGIHICLLTLKTGAVAKGKSLEKEIANAQLFVNTSSKTMGRIIRQGNHEN